MQIFAGSSNRTLAEAVGELLSSKLGEMEITKFANGETRVWVRESKVEKEVVVLQSLSTPTNEHLVEFCLICDALHRGGAKEITAVIPWMGYSKQDKVFRNGEPLSAKVVAQILQVARIEKILTFDLHNRATLGFFDIPVIELSAKPILMEYFGGIIHGELTGEPRLAPTKNNYVVVSPDAGAVKASTEFAKNLNLQVLYMDKKRDLASGEVTVVGMSRPVAGRNVIMVDDNVFTGATLLSTAKELKRAGARSIRVGLTHHLYVPGVQEKIEASKIDEIVVSDTVLNTGLHVALSSRLHEDKNWGKLKVLSVAGIIAGELTNK
jgi:ribose-phosphate pyrophosphokinase